jgi:3',5'-cyclic AMP phosphodiesterase CpdA
MKHELKFQNDGTFKIVQFTDVHMGDGTDEDLKTKELMDKILESEKPDLVVFTGDLCYSENNEASLREAIKPVECSGVPWAAVFGNHDAEIGSGKEKLLRVQQESYRCLTVAGDKELSGLCNYYLTINGSLIDKPNWVLYLMDSGDYNPNERVEGYDFIKRNQIDWYTKLSLKLKKQYGNIPGLAFFHIPLIEYNDVWDISTCYGEKNESCCCPRQNSGLFSAMLEMGNVKGVFVGHDHINDYYGDLYGIKLCYGRATGYNTYGKENFAHGARIIILRESQKSFETWVRLDDGKIIMNPIEHISKKV